MRVIVLSAVLFLCIGSAHAPATGPAAGKTPPAALALVQTAHSRDGRAFRRCMREKYGPRYFARVPRVYRWHMAQACMA